MAETTIKIVRVFIASPGGLEAERQTARRIVEEINQSHSERWGCQIKLVGWEATLPGYSRAQTLINRELDKCEYFVGVIWNHWGSKPKGGDKKYSSGFEEEYERAKAGLKKGFVKDIILYFKEIPELQLKDLGPSVKKVIAFREKCVKERTPLFKQFKDTSDFEPMLRASIGEIGWNESRYFNELTLQPPDSGQPAKTDDQKANVPTAAGGLIGQSAARFIAELLQRPADWGATTPHEAARFRLIATGTSRSGNDDLHLGSHDANLLFVKRNDFDFSAQEISTLLETGIAGFHHQNVPLWHWISVSGDFQKVAFWAVIGSSQKMRNAVRILQAAGQGTPIVDEILDRERAIRIWLLGEQAIQDVEVALDFLKTNGGTEDLAILEKLRDEVADDRQNRVAETIVAILATTNPQGAFKRLIELDPDPVRESVVTKVFSNPDSIPTETLERCLTLKSDIIRRNAATLLQARHAIDLATAKRLMTDTDPEIRLVAVESLIEQGQALEEETIKSVLVPRTSSTFGNYFFASAGRRDQTDLSYYERYRRDQLSRLSYGELQKKAEASDLSGYLEISTLNQRFTGRNLRAIRRDLDEGFKGVFDDKLKKLTSLHGDETTVVTRAKEKEGYLRSRLVSQTLDALCVYGQRTDLKLVRKTLDQYEVDFLVSALLYLGRFGDWSDKDRILSLINHYIGRQPFLSGGWDEQARPVAAALYAIGKSRLVDLLRLDADIAVKRALVAKMSQKDIRNLGDDIIVAELNNRDGQFRKVLALKCALAMSPARIRKLLDKYISQDEPHYYNSVHWLDLGASIPSRIVKAVAIFELAAFE